MFFWGTLVTSIVNMSSTDNSSNTTTDLEQHQLPQSQLGTKEYWEAIYERDLDNYGDHGDEGEIW